MRPPPQERSVGNRPDTRHRATVVDRVLAHVGEGIVALDRDLRYVYVNDAAVRLMGMRREQVLGRTPWEILGPETLDETLPRIDDAMRQGRVVQYESQARETGRWYEHRLYPAAEGVTMFFTDITARKRAEAALAAARDAADADAQRLSLALTAAHLGDWIWDAATDRLSLSPRAAEILEIPAGAPVSWAALDERLHPDDRARVRTVMQEVRAGRGDSAIECRIVAGGRERWVSARGRARFDDHGRLAGMLGVVQDITRDRMLVRLDDALRPLADPDEITATAARMLGQYLQVTRCAWAVVDADEDGFVLAGAATDPERRAVSRYTFRQFGAECRRLVQRGEPCVVSDHRTDDRLDDEDRRAYEGAGIRAVIFVPIRKAGRVVAAMIVHTDRPRRWDFQDVEVVQQVASRCWESMERARVERERASLLEAAEAANRAKDEFLAMLGHELRNPLSPILTAVQLMRLRGESAAETARTVIERQVNHLTRLVDDLLDVSRIARGKVELKTAVVELAEVVARAIEMASPLLDQRAQTLRLDVRRTGLTIEADVLRLSQVVANLLTNAAKYTPSGGVITVTGGVEDDQVVLRVRDTGIGIPPEALPRIFDLFVQGRQTIDRAQGGLGLGLTIVRSLVERHGGTVTAESEGPDRGSEFVVRLPRAPAPAAAAAPPTLPDGNGSVHPRARILIVDDNEDAAEMLSAVLRAKGYETLVAHDGLDALRFAAAHRPHAAFLDIGLPVMDGYELAVRIRELPAMSHVRLVAVTGYGQASDKDRAAAAGFHHHFVKPVNFDEIETLVASLATDG
jgi:PAS domain S-box-containing protein